jgi:hypothetical protein
MDLADADSGAEGLALDGEHQASTGGGVAAREQAGDGGGWDEGATGGDRPGRRGDRDDVGKTTTASGGFSRSPARSASD